MSDFNDYNNDSQQPEVNQNPQPQASQQPEQSGAPQQAQPAEPGAPKAEEISSSQPYVPSFQPAQPIAQQPAQAEAPVSGVQSASDQAPAYTYASAPGAPINPAPPYAPQPPQNSQQFQPPQGAQQNQYAGAPRQPAYQQPQPYQWSNDTYRSGQYAHQNQGRYAPQHPRKRGGAALVTVIVILSLLLVGAIVWIAYANLSGNSTVGTDPGNNIVASTQAQQSTTSLQQGNAALSGNNSSSGTTAPTQQGDSSQLSSYSQIVANAIAKNENCVVGIDCTGGSGWNAFESQGTGIIVRSDGYIVTNEHVIDSADKITVYLANNKSYDATLVGSDVMDDLAVIKINETGLSVAEFGDSSALVMGEIAIAIGCPSGLDLQGTCTTGIISYPARTLQVSNDKTVTVIQTSAPINSGNSGGPLINDRGQVVGINSMKLGSGYEGIGFAIPIDYATPIIEQIINTGTVANDSNNGYVQAKGYLGISGQDVDSQTAAANSEPMGFQVAAVQPGSPAETVGIQVGDIITGIDGTTVTSYNDLTAVLNQHYAGDTVTIQLWRSGKTITVKPTLYYYNTNNQSATG